MTENDYKGSASCPVKHAHYYVVANTNQTGALLLYFIKLRLHTDSELDDMFNIVSTRVGEVKVFFYLDRTSFAVVQALHSLSFLIQFERILNSDMESIPASIIANRWRAYFNTVGDDVIINVINPNSCI